MCLVNINAVANAKCSRLLSSTVYVKKKQFSVCYCRIKFSFDVILSDRLYVVICQGHKSLFRFTSVHVYFLLKNKVQVNGLKNRMKIFVRTVCIAAIFLLIQYWYRCYYLLFYVKRIVTSLWHLKDIKCLENNTNAKGSLLFKFAKWIMLVFVFWFNPLHTCMWKLFHGQR